LHCFAIALPRMCRLPCNCMRSRLAFVCTDDMQSMYCAYITSTIHCCRLVHSTVRYCSDGQLAQHKLAHPAGTTSNATAAATTATTTAGDTAAGAAVDDTVQWQLRAQTARRRDLTRRNSCSLGVCNARNSQSNCQSNCHSNCYGNLSSIHEV
jgi:hypothetical protein